MICYVKWADELWKKECTAEDFARMEALREQLVDALRASSFIDEIGEVCGHDPWALRPHTHTTVRDEHPVQP